MNAVIQRVESASVRVGPETVATIGTGLVTLLGIRKGDTEETVEKLISKIVHLRVFPDSQGKLNLSLLDVKGDHLIVSQFTLLGDCRKGNRPDFQEAETAERAKELYTRALETSRSLSVPTKEGVFQAEMKVSLVNDGPVTLLINL